MNLLERGNANPRPSGIGQGQQRLRYFGVAYHRRCHPPTAAYREPPWGVPQPSRRDSVAVRLFEFDRQSQRFGCGLRALIQVHPPPFRLRSGGIGGPRAAGGDQQGFRQLRIGGESSVFAPARRARDDHYVLVFGGEQFSHPRPSQAGAEGRGQDEGRRPARFQLEVRQIEEIGDETCSAVADGDIQPLGHSLNLVVYRPLSIIIHSESGELRQGGGRALQQGVVGWGGVGRVHDHQVAGLVGYRKPAPVLTAGGYRLGPVAEQSRGDFPGQQVQRPGFHVGRVGFVGAERHYMRFRLRVVNGRMGGGKGGGGDVDGGGHDVASHKHVLQHPSVKGGVVNSPAAHAGPYPLVGGGQEYTAPAREVGHPQPGYRVLVAPINIHSGQGHLGQQGGGGGKSVEAGQELAVGQKSTETPARPGSGSYGRSPTPFGRPPRSAAQATGWPPARRPPP